jgi:hypothetical protein
MRVLILQPKTIFIDMDKLTLHGLSQFYIKLEENQKTRKLTDLMDILGADSWRSICAWSIVFYGLVFT